MQTTTHSRASQLAPALLLLLAAAPAASPQADVPAAGFDLLDDAYPGQALTATLDDGRIVSFDGQVVALHDADGDHERDLATLPAFAFGSFLLVAPDESFVLLGESTNGNLYRVDVALGGETLVTTLPFNFDASFESAATLIVSAATCGFGCGNELYRVDALTGVTTLVATVGGASGPVVVEPDGDVVYGRVSDTFSLGDHRVLRFDAALLTGNPVAGEPDASVVGEGFDGSSDLACDPRDGALYLAENDFATGLNRIRWVRGDAANSPVLLDGAPGRTLSNLELEPGEGEGLLRAYQPSDAGRLRYNTTDFVTTYARRQIVPARPALALSGPGASGAGPLTLTVSGGAPDGAWALLFGPTATFDPDESTLVLAALEAPLFYGLELATLELDPTLTLLDANGNGQRSVPHDGSLLGLLTAQALTLDAGLRVVQVSSAASL